MIVFSTHFGFLVVVGNYDYIRVFICSFCNYTVYRVNRINDKYEDPSASAECAQIVLCAWFVQQVAEQNARQFDAPVSSMRNEAHYENGKASNKPNMHHCQWPSHYHQHGYDCGEWVFGFKIRFPIDSRAARFYSCYFFTEISTQKLTLVICC